MLTESERVYDTRLRQWTATVTSVKGKSQKIGDSQCHPDTTVQEKARQGWALRKQKATAESHLPSRNTSRRCFNEGTKDGRSKASSADVAEDLKIRFARPEWLVVLLVKHHSVTLFFSL